MLPDNIEFILPKANHLQKQHQKAMNVHLRLTLACEGGKGCANSVEMRHKSTSGSLLQAREVEVVLWRRNVRKKHLRLTFVCEGGGGCVNSFKM